MIGMCLRCYAEKAGGLSGDSAERRHFEFGHGGLPTRRYGQKFEDVVKSAKTLRCWCWYIEGRVVRQTPSCANSASKIQPQAYGQGTRAGKFVVKVERV